jgi:hypothetical protein
MRKMPKSFDKIEDFLFYIYFKPFNIFKTCMVLFQELNAAAAYTHAAAAYTRVAAAYAHAAAAYTCSAAAYACAAAAYMRQCENNT